MKNIKKKEEIDRILNKSKSVSIYDMFQIRNVARITICAICMTINVYVTRVIYKNVFTNYGGKYPEGSTSIAKNITNSNFLMGIVIMLMSFMA